MSFSLFPFMLMRAGGQTFDNLKDILSQDLSPFLADLWNSEVDLSNEAILTINNLYELVRLSMADKPVQRTALMLKRDIHNSRKIDFEKYNYYPFNQILSGYKSLWEMVQEKRISFFNLYEEEEKNELQRFRKTISNESFLNGLLFSSNALFQETEKFLEPEMYNWSGRKNERIAIGLMKYYSRMVVKTSPFSSFTTTSVIDMRNQTADNGFPCENRARIILNANCYKYIVSGLCKYRPIRHNLTLKLNTTLRLEGKKTFFLADIEGRECLQEMDITPFVKEVVRLFENAKSGILTINTIGKKMAESVDAPFDELIKRLDDFLNLGLYKPSFKANYKYNTWLDDLAEEIVEIAPKDAFIKKLKLQLKCLSLLCTKIHGEELRWLSKSGHRSDKNLCNYGNGKIGKKASSEV